MESQQPNGNDDGSDHLRKDDTNSVTSLGFNTVQTIESPWWYTLNNEWERNSSADVIQ